MLMHYEKIIMLHVVKMSCFLKFFLFIICFVRCLWFYLNWVLTYTAKILKGFLCVYSINSLEDRNVQSYDSYL